MFHSREVPREYGSKSSLLGRSTAKHGRKASVASYATTIPDEKHSTLSPTPTGTTAAATLIDNKKKKGEGSEESGPVHIDPNADTTDPTPFEQKPLVLASLVDPKSLPSLEAMGGTEGHNVRCDESGTTGESDAIKKVTYEECMNEAKNLKAGQKTKLDCFIVSGAKVLEGVGQYVVIAVGHKSFNGRIMAALSGHTESTPLQLKLDALAELIAKIGSAAGLILFTALMIKFFVQLKTHSERTSTEKAMLFVQILIVSVTLIVIAVPEGLPLAVTLALAFAAKRMTKERLLVRVLGSCETMANASVVCTDKTSTLTQNVMSVVAGSVGIHCKFVKHLSKDEGCQNVDRVVEDQDVNSECDRSHKGDSCGLPTSGPTLAPRFSRRLSSRTSARSWVSCRGLYQ